jgi:hypothetical protein
MFNETILLASENSLILKWYLAWKAVSAHEKTIIELNRSIQELTAKLAIQM